MQLCKVRVQQVGKRQQWAVDMQKVKKIQWSHFSSEFCLPLYYTLSWSPGKTPEILLNVLCSCSLEQLKWQLFHETVVASSSNWNHLLVVSKFCCGVMESWFGWTLRMKICSGAVKWWCNQIKYYLLIYH